MLGRFPTRMTFAGVLRYRSAGDLDAALAAVVDLLDGDDLELELGLARKDLALRVRVDHECPRDWYHAYEALIEALADQATGGEIVGEIDDTITAYAPPKGSQIEPSLIKAWFVPLFAMPELGALVVS